MSRRRPKGIFGMPSKNMLFSFTPRAGDEWPDEEDDDDDSDYEPGDSLKPMVEDIPRSSDSDASDDAEEMHSSKKRKRKIKPAKGVKRTKKDNKEKSKSSQKRKDKVRTKQMKRKNDVSKRRAAEGEGSSKDKTPTRAKPSCGTVSHQLSEGADPWGQQLPLVALQRILEFAVSEAGAVPLLCRISRLSHLWRDAAGSSLLWQHVDLNNGRVKATDATLNWLTTNRFSSQLATLNLGGWTKLTDRSFVTCVEACPNIRNLSIQRCAKLTNVALHALMEHCHQLERLDLGFTGSSLVSSPSLRDLLKQRGQTLQELQLTGCSIVSSVQLMNTIKSYCPNLRLLDFSNCHLTTESLMFPVEALQKACPLLEILRLAGTRVQAPSTSAQARSNSPGFTRLKELSVAVADDIAWQVVLPANMGVSDDFLRRVLKTSPDLRLLDLRGCALITMATMQNLTVENLEQLYISRCLLTKHEGFNDMVSKWSHSLVELDLSWCAYLEPCLDQALKTLSSSPRLKVLDLSGTNVLASSVEHILKGCPGLESIKLTSCRSLPRGTKRWYQGHKSLRQLKKELKG